MGDNTLPDQVAGIKELAKRYPWIDVNRVGIWGHSGGGNASTDAMFRYPDFFVRFYRTFVTATEKIYPLLDVITSYSIHYTKLYESRGRFPGAASRRSRRRRIRA